MRNFSYVIRFFRTYKLNSVKVKSCHRLKAYKFDFQTNIFDIIVVDFYNHGLKDIDNYDFISNCIFELKDICLKGSSIYYF